MTKYIIFLLLLFFIGLTSAYIISIYVTHSQRIPSSGITPLPTQTPTEIFEDKNTTILFGGDMMFDRSIRQSINKNGADFILSDLQHVLKSADVVVANLEGPITDNTSISVNSEPGSSANFLFTFDPNILPILKSNNMIVNLGNNHITNFGTDGITQTRTYLNQENIPHFGDTGSEKSSEERVLFHTIHNKKFAFVNHNQFTTNGFEHALEDIAFAKSKTNTDTDTIIVYTHWGNEYVPTANTIIQNQAHQFVDAGADVVIGSHPHVVQQKEIYKDKTIYYSLGNLVFDQYFSEETKKGLLVKMTIKSDDILDFREIPVQLLPNGKTVIYDEK